MRNRWVAFILTVLFGSFGAIYTWKYDKAFLITALIGGFVFGAMGSVEAVMGFGVIIQVILVITVLVREQRLYDEYELK